MKLYCRICGATLEEHKLQSDCKFDPMGLPDDCLCDPLSWSMHSGDAPPICGHFKSKNIGRGEFCTYCGHTFLCHIPEIDNTYYEE